MKRSITFVLCALSLIVVSGCWQREPTLYVINVLETKSYDECHILGSISVPYAKVKEWANRLPNKEVEIIVYCANYACTASEFAAQYLLEQGFVNVWAYEAGMHDWHKSGYPQECPVESAYLTQENKAPDQATVDVPTITTEQLYEKMIKHGIFE